MVTEEIDLARCVTTFVLAHGREVEFLRRCIGSIHSKWPAILPRTHVILADPDEALCRFASGTLMPAMTARMLGSVTMTHNPGKYVLMRKAFYDAERGLPETPYVMWFDCDSYVKPLAGPEHLAAMISLGGDLVGSAHHCRLTGNQHLWAREQPWANGGEAKMGEDVSFSVGGWWLARMAYLERIGYPWPTLRHRGGDVMLGLAMKWNGGQRYALTEEACPVVVNADMAGVPHTRRNRDAGAIQEKPVGWDF